MVSDSFHYLYTSIFIPISFYVSQRFPQIKDLTKEISNFIWIVEILVQTVVDSVEKFEDFYRVAPDINFFPSIVSTEVIGDLWLESTKRQNTSNMGWKGSPIHINQGMKRGFPIF